MLIETVTPGPIEGRHERPVEKDEVSHRNPFYAASRRRIYTRGERADGARASLQGRRRRASRLGALGRGFGARLGLTRAAAGAQCAKRIDHCWWDGEPKRDGFALSGELERVQEVGDFGMIWSGLHAAQSDEALHDLTQVLRGLVVTRLSVNEAFNAAADDALD